MMGDVGREGTPVMVVVIEVEGPAVGDNPGAVPISVSTATLSETEVCYLNVSVGRHARI